MGDLCFKGLSADGVTEIGYGLLEEHWGKGYATEAVKAAVDWAASQQGVKTIEAETEEWNTASKRVLEKAGFVPTGKNGEEGPRFVWQGVTGNFVKLKYGNTNTYFINGLLVDTDMPGTFPLLCREMGKNGLTLADIKYVIATHYHPDHMGIIGELVSRGVKLVIAENQLAYVHSSDAILARDAERFVPTDERNAKIISLDESRAFLAPLGINGVIVPTESHSPDGIALLLDDGHAFVGDLEPASFIEAYGSESPLASDWEKIRKHGISFVHTGHTNDIKL